MLDIARGANAVPVAPVVSVALPVPQHVPYEVVERRGRIFLGRFFRHNDESRFQGYYGRLTGKPVFFSRRSDAERLCRVLNGQEQESI